MASASAFSVSPSAALDWQPARTWGVAALQVALLSALWLAAEALRGHLGWGIPAGLMGFAVLALGLFSGVIQPRWLAGGTRWLLSDMLLFFIPAMLVVVDYGALVRSDGWRILLVIVLSTMAVMVATALTVDAVYRLELRLSQRKRRHQRASALAPAAALRHGKAV